jgi:hypothetical protein
MIARIGHVFGADAGIFPFLKLSSKLRIKKLGDGEQYIPWVHIEDVVESMYFMIENGSVF